VVDIRSIAVSPSNPASANSIESVEPLYGRRIQFIFMQSITPYLYYEDLDAALEWLAKAFGLQEHGKRFTGLNGKTNHAAMKLKDDVVMMGCPGAGYKNPKRLGQTTQSLHVIVSDVDERFERAKKAGAVILHAPEDKFYGLRQFGAADLEGHQWYFAQNITKRKGVPQEKSGDSKSKRPRSTSGKTRG
jgi:PhnB protein